jgi:hypothetical protein
MRALRRNDRIGQLDVQRLALPVQALELGAVAGQGPVAVTTARPGHLEPHVEPDHEVVLERRANTLVPDRPATERQHAGLGRIEQLERHPLLGGPERGLAVLGEHALDRFP